MLMILPGCIGTYGTRMLSDPVEKNASFVGGYPFMAVAVDCSVIGGSSTGCGNIFKSACFLSLPFDLVVDAVLSPIDLIMWPFGFRMNDG